MGEWIDGRTLVGSFRCGDKTAGLCLELKDRRPGRQDASKTISKVGRWLAWSSVSALSNRK